MKMKEISITKYARKLPENKLMWIFVLLMLIGSGCSRHPCAPYSETDDDDNHVDLLRNQCELEIEKFHLICSGGLDDEWNNGSNIVQILTLCRLPEESLDPEQLLGKFPILKNLSIFDSNLTHLDTPFPSTAKYLRNVTFNGTKLDELLEDAFSMLPALSILDLRNNVLSIINSKALAGPFLQDVYLAGNPWKCVPEMSWILNLTSDPVASRIVDRDKLICSILNFDRPLIPVLEIMEELRKQCLQIELCTCHLEYVGRGTAYVEMSPGASQWEIMAATSDDGISHRKRKKRRELMVFVTVNCSSGNFNQMPKFIPANTTVLYLSNNQIHDLSPLKTNPVYKGVKDVYLDDNEVESIAVLEGSAWLDQFRALSLRGNRLTDLPPYVLENALQQNPNAVSSVYLGKNPWRCDCSVTPGFQELLRRHEYLFKDMHDITCSNVENDENSGKEIFHLKRIAICILPPEGIQPLDVLNVVLALLIFLIFGKLLYDYWTFKRTGKLPWIVTKIP